MNIRGAAVFTTAASLFRARRGAPPAGGGIARAAALALLLALAAPRGAAAGLDLAWNACAGAGGDSAIALGCSQPDSVALLFGCFQSPRPVPRFFAMDVVLEVECESPGLPNFWHFETNGCNGYALVISDALPDSGCSGVANLWGPRGSLAYAFVTGYGPGVGGLNRARVLCTVTRPANDPIALEAGQNYFGFGLQIFNDKAREAGGTCDGCRTPATIRWISCTLYGAAAKSGEPEPRPVVIHGPGLRGSCVSVNGGSLSACAARAAADSLSAPQR